MASKHATSRNAYVNNCNGDLLMDVPSKFTWNELKHLAANREGWRKRVHAITMKEGVSVNMSGEGGKIVSAQPPEMKKYTPIGKREPKPATSNEKAGRQYRKRDEHEAFVLSGRQRGKRQAVKHKKKTDHSQINKERAEAKRAHWDQHHGNRTTSPVTRAATSPPTTSATTPAS